MGLGGQGSGLGAISHWRGLESVEKKIFLTGTTTNLRTNNILLANKSSSRNLIPLHLLSLWANACAATTKFEASMALF